MSLFSLYLEERENIITIERDNGFITYALMGSIIWIKDLYVVPGKRRSKVGTDLANEVADIGVEKKCDKMICTVCPKANGSTGSIMAVLSYGFTLKHTEPNLIYFEKDL